MINGIAIPDSIQTNDKNEHVYFEKMTPKEFETFKKLNPNRKIEHENGDVYRITIVSDEENSEVSSIKSNNESEN